MKYNKFVAPVMAGMLSVTLGLAGCGNNNQATEAPKETTETTTQTTTETPESTQSPTEATVEEQAILFWTGETDEGDSVLYTEDVEAGTAGIILFGSHDGTDEAYAFSGPVKQDGTQVTITDSETDDEFSFDLTEESAAGMTVDLGEHGTTTLKPVTEAEFKKDLEKILDAVNEVGEELSTLDEQDFEELLGVLAVMAESEVEAVTPASQAETTTPAN